MLISHKKALTATLVVMILSLSVLAPSQAVDGIVIYDPKKEDALELFRQGYASYNRGRYEEAIAAFESSLAAYPTFTRTHFWKARSHYRLAQFETALDELSLALRPDPEPYPEDIDDRRQRVLLSGDVARWMNTIESKGREDGGDGVVSRRYLHSRTISGRSFGKGGFYTPTDLYLDPSGNIYVVSFGGDKVIKLDTNGRFLMRIGSGRGEGKFDRPYGVALDSKGNIYVSDFGKDRIVKFNSQGTFLNQFGAHGNKDGELVGPEGLAIDSNDYVYIADSGNNRVQKYDSSGSFLMKFGGKGEREGEFMGPHSIAINSKGHILVSDFDNDRIQEFDSSGNYLREFGGNILTNPRGLAVDAQDNVYVATNSGYIHRFSPDHEHTLSLNSWLLRGEERSFMVPSDVAVDSSGFLYVADYEKFSLETFIPQEAKMADLSVTINRTDTDSFPLVVNYVSVWGEEDKPIAGLTGENFFLRENGERIHPIEVIPMDVEKEQARTSVVLVIDNALEMKSNRRLLETITESITKGLGGDDLAALIEVGGVAKERVDFTSDQKSLTGALSRLRYREKEKALYDGLYMAIRKSINLLGRRAVVLIAGSDRDGVSVHPPEEIIALSRINYVPIYVLDFGRNAGLAELAARSGGAYYDARTSSRIVDINQQLKGLSLNQYIVVYQTSEIPRRNRWRDVTIDVYFNSLSGLDRALYWGP